MSTMKTLYMVAGLIAASTACAQSYQISFDSLKPGDSANLAAPPGFRFNEATFSPDYDSDGDAVLGSERWRINSEGLPITVQDPSFYDRGVASPPSLALDGIFQPTLMSFGSRVSLTDFSVTLDKDTYGDASARIEFYRIGPTANTLLGWIPAVQTVPGYTARFQGSITDVDAVLLPSGALYNNINLEIVPEPSKLAMLGIGFVAVLGISRRYPKSKSR